MMRALGYLLITAGFLVGAYFAVRTPVGLDLGPFLLGLAIGAVGIVLVRRDLRQAATHAGRLSSDLSTLEASLERIVENVRVLDRDFDREGGSIDVYDLRHRIDERFPGDLARFVEARQSLAHRYGLQSYADVMNPFSAGERYLNRVWSTSTDGYIDEAHEYLGRSHEQFEDALAVVRRLRSEGGAGAPIDPSEPGGPREPGEPADSLRPAGLETPENV
jgi:hypothetical protein